LAKDFVFQRIGRSAEIEIENDIGCFGFQEPIDNLGGFASWPWPEANTIKTGFVDGHVDDVLCRMPFVELRALLIKNMLETVQISGPIGPQYQRKDDWQPKEA